MVLVVYTVVVVGAAVVVVVLIVIVVVVVHLAVKFCFYHIHPDVHKPSAYPLFLRSFSAPRCLLFGRPEMWPSFHCPWRKESEFPSVIGRWRSRWAKLPGKTSLAFRKETMAD